MNNTMQGIFHIHCIVFQITDTGTATATINFSLPPFVYSSQQYISYEINSP
jgi:hypothetical protein